MKNVSPLRILLALMQLFVAVTAVPGGVALILNFNAPPTDLLQGSPFSSFLVPGIALACVVGGSALIAAVMLLRKLPRAYWYSIAAGILLLAFELTELIVIGSPEGAGRTLQLLYISIGLLELGFSIMLFRINAREVL